MAGPWWWRGRLMSGFGTGWEGGACATGVDEVVSSCMGSWMRGVETVWAMGLNVFYLSEGGRTRSC